MSCNVSTQTPNYVPGPTPDANARPWRMVMWMSGVFSLLVGLTMVVGELGYQPVRSLASPKVAELKENLRRNPNDEQLKKSIRELDLKQRRQYFRQLSHMQSGAYLLIGGA